MGTTFIPGSGRFLPPAPSPLRGLLGACSGWALAVYVLLYVCWCPCTASLTPLHTRVGLCIVQRGFSPLMCACEVLASSQLTRMLIKRGANINYVSVSAFTRRAPFRPSPLRVCANLGFILGGPPAPQVDSGLTPLLIAAKTGNTKALHVLLDKGASVTARDVRVPILVPTRCPPAPVGLCCAHLLLLLLGDASAAVLSTRGLPLWAWVFFTQARELRLYVCVLRERLSECAWCVLCCVRLYVLCVCIRAWGAPACTGPVWRAQSQHCRCFCGRRALPSLTSKMCVAAPACLLSCLHSSSM